MKQDLANVQAPSRRARSLRSDTRGAGLVEYVGRRALADRLPQRVAATTVRPAAVHRGDHAAEDSDAEGTAKR